jgi:hypothetical protein
LSSAEMKGIRRGWKRAPGMLQSTAGSACYNLVPTRTPA